MTQRPNIQDFITEKTKITNELYDFISELYSYIDELENQIDNTQTLQLESKGQLKQKFVALFRKPVQIAPDDWEAKAEAKLCDRQTTIGEIVDWYKSKSWEKAKLHCEIVEAE